MALVAANASPAYVTLRALSGAVPYAFPRAVYPAAIPQYAYSRAVYPAAAPQYVVSAPALRLAAPAPVQIIAQPSLAYAVPNAAVYRASNPGATHEALLPGHSLSVLSENLELAPGASSAPSSAPSSEPSSE